MSNFQYTMVGTDDGKQFISVFVPGTGFKSADSDHPMFGKIVKLVTGYEGEQITPQAFLGLFDVAAGVQTAIQDAHLSSRVAVEHGALTLDGQPLSDALAAHILKLLAEQSGDLTGWVRFLERIDANTNEHSRKMLFSWLDSLDKNDGGITIDAKTGFLVGYKGVRKNEDGTLVSVHAGPAIVDGVEHTGGPVPNAVGSVIEMPVDQVTFDPSIGCSRGLHVGTWSYASGWAQGAVLEVHVDPADVRSVPTDCDAQKMRCSKYTVVRVLDAPYSTATLPVDGSDEDDDEFVQSNDLPDHIKDDGPRGDDSAEGEWCGNCFDGEDVKVTLSGIVYCDWQDCQRVVHDA